MSHDVARLRRAYTHTLLLAGRQYRRAANAVAETYGLSDATALPLLMIGRHESEPRQNALAEAVGIEGASLVRLLDQLCAAGMVTRKEDPTDRRAKVLSLTPEGSTVVARMEADLEGLRATIFGEVDSADIEASLRVFHALSRHAGEATP